MRHVTFALVALVLLVGFGATTASSREDGTALVAQVTSADHEVAEGYFALGQKTTLIAQPGSELHAWLSSHRGRRVRVTITPVDPQTDSEY